MLVLLALPVLASAYQWQQCGGGRTRANVFPPHIIPNNVDYTPSPADTPAASKFLSPPVFVAANPSLNKPYSVFQVVVRGMGRACARARALGPCAV